MTHLPHILYLEETTTDVEKFKHELTRNGFDCGFNTVNTLQECKDHINSSKPDIIFAAYQIDQHSGTDIILECIKSAPFVPVVMVTDELDETKARHCIQAGAADVIDKNQLYRLTACIRNILCTNKNDQTSIKETQTKEYNGNLNEILASMPRAMLSVYDQEGKYIQVWGNEQLLNQYGIKSKELIGKSISIFYSPKDAIDRIGYIKRIFKTGETFHHTVLTKHPKLQTNMWLDITLSPIFDNNGNVVNVAGFLLDVTDRMMAEQELKRLSTAFEQVAECIVITDTNGKIEYVNKVVEKVTGYKREELINKNSNIFKSEKHSNDFYKNMWKIILSGKIWYGHIHNKKKDGNIYEEEVTITPIKDVDGIIKNYVAVKRDVTNELKMEKQLRQAQKMEAIGTLAGGIAHDFNNILAAILGYTELSLRDLQPDSKLYKHLQQVLQAGYRAKDLIKQILAFSRQSQQEVKPLQISLIIKEALKLLRASLPATIEMRQNIRNHSSMVLADPTQIHQLMMNLCTNAAHALRHNGGLLEVKMNDVELSEQDASHYHGIRPGPYIKLSVSDNGHGMPPDIVERIFEPYFTTKKQGEGTGMGLSVVHGIIKSHSGDITVYSESGKGTTFNILLPRLESGEQEKEVQTSRLPLGTENILFVDDEDTLVEIGQEMLEQLGYSVTAMTNSMDALESFQQEPDKYDLIITDQTMPYLTGAELSRKALKIKPDIPIILCTGFSEVMSEDKAKEIGIHEFIMKPIFMKEIAFVIRRLLDHETVGENT